jgi:multidrug efflux pump subunit AcrA (membrane-fusion protein)
VANNNGLEITAFIGESDRPFFTVGDSVLLGEVATGTITNISPAVDATTGKIEIRISADTSTLKNGDTVRVVKTIETTTTSDITIPLTAVKFERSDGYIFTVTDNTLVRVPVKVGDISGDSVIILEGITQDTEIVVDARGKTEGLSVTVNK